MKLIEKNLQTNWRLVAILSIGVVFLVVVLLAAILASTKETKKSPVPSEKGEEYLTVSIRDFKRDPILYHNKKILVGGIYRWGFEHSNFDETADSEEYNIWIEIDELKTKLENRPENFVYAHKFLEGSEVLTYQGGTGSAKVTIYGTFHAFDPNLPLIKNSPARGNFGHLGLWKHQIVADKIVFHDEKNLISYRFDPSSGDTLIYRRPDITENIAYELVKMWHYNVDRNQWETNLYSSKKRGPFLLDEKINSIPMSRVLGGTKLPVGLYYVSTKVNRSFEHSLVFHGPILCNDVSIGNPPEGMIATCVPFADHAEAMFVPDPTKLTLDQTESEIQNWQTYRNEEFGFEVTYPPMLTFTFSPEESGFSYDWGEQQEDSFRIASSLHFGPEIYDFMAYSNPQNLSLDEFLEKKLSRVVKIQIHERGDIVFGHQNIQGRLFRWGHPENKSVLVSKDDVIIEIHGDKGLNGYPQTFNQILSTFRFVE